MGIVGPRFKSVNRVPVKRGPTLFDCRFFLAILFLHRYFDLLSCSLLSVDNPPPSGASTTVVNPVTAVPGVPRVSWIKCGSMIVVTRVMVVQGVRWLLGMFILWSTLTGTGLVSCVWGISPVTSLFICNDIILHAGHCSSSFVRLKTHLIFFLTASLLQVIFGPRNETRPPLCGDLIVKWSTPLVRIAGHVVTTLLYVKCGLVLVGGRVLYEHSSFLISPTLHGLLILIPGSCMS